MAKGRGRNKLEELMRSRDIPAVCHIPLLLLSLLYGLIIDLRLLLYKVRILGRVKLPVKVISVGNITAGGTGKTPVVICLAELLKGMGKRVVVLSRGYKGLSEKNGDGGLLVSETSSPVDVGDEPFLIHKRTGVDVVVGSDRVASGRFAQERLGAEVLLLDDGFQHIRLERDLNILLADGEAPLGNGYLLPRGMLRERLSGTRRSDLLLVKGGLSGMATGGASGDLESLKRAVDGPHLRFDYRAESVISLVSGEERGVEYIKGKRVFAFCGTANPEAFFGTLRGLGCEVVDSVPYPDHHTYTAGDLEEICRHGYRGIDMIITTEKDGVKVGEMIKKGSGGEGSTEIYTLPITLESDDLKTLQGALEGLFSDRQSGG